MRGLGKNTGRHAWLSRQLCKVRKKMFDALRLLLLLLPAMLMLAPLLLILPGSVMSRQELSGFLKPVLDGG